MMALSECAGGRVDLWADLNAVLFEKDPELSRLLSRFSYVFCALFFCASRFPDGSTEKRSSHG
jgi:hypothetical protein